ncbi:hypothetical protein P153DRAFT_382391 [Dothidotthia symphoricarpi CBS 119687]|uniref:Uncharacterized protein n=1 Tax=Dothidotthia symphoricarpi CBS 119687 TaxID=1392245 RepID=A0A6A6AP97_9PLEO|nr:uncharacterized protein P153DRAFT_382391 [Dothidotthia symphoricarpi CBS 119687]KAF2132764.1 hypothetical protein P153DRAFT_382391 [Dothidotthia symphoricarpi CBS 119687]
MAVTRSKTPYSRVDSDIIELRSTEVLDKSGSGDINHHPTSRKPSPPWSGVVALTSVILLTIAAVGVLLVSNGSPIDRWQIRNMKILPQVWLSILTTIMDGVTMFALADAARITYWRAAARGSTLRDMFDLYESHSFLGALNNMAHLRPDRLAIVSIFCLFSTLRGPLFQRTSVVIGGVTQKTSGMHQIHVAQLIPPGFLYPEVGVTSKAYDEVYDAYLERAPIYVHVDEAQCGDMCIGKVKGYGSDIECSDLTTIPWDTSENSTVRQQFQDTSNRIGGAVPSFNSSAYLPDVVWSETGETDVDSFTAAETRGWFDVVNLFKTEPICGGHLSISRCSLHHAVVEYEVKLQDGIVSLLHDHWQDDTVLFQTATWNLTNPNTNWGPTTQWASWYMGIFNQEISIYPDGDNGPFAGVDVRFLLAKRFINGNINAVNCSTTFSDPTQFVLDRLREMAFRTAVAAANVTDLDVIFPTPLLLEQGLPLTQNWTQQVSLNGEKHIVAFGVSVPYLICAIVSSLLSVIAIAPLLWNSWRKGFVQVSFNPLDVAHVFAAPLLEEANCEKNMEDYIRKESGLQRVRCSANRSDGTTGMLLAKMNMEDM